MTEASQLEGLTDQIDSLDCKGQAAGLSGHIALVKSYATHCAQEPAGEAVHIFDGRGLTPSPLGKVVDVLQDL